MSQAGILTSTVIPEHRNPDPGSRFTMTPSHTPSLTHRSPHDPHLRPRPSRIYKSFPPSPPQETTPPELSFLHLPHQHHNSCSQHIFNTAPQGSTQTHLSHPLSNPCPQSPTFAAPPNQVSRALIASTNGVATLAALEATGTDKARIAELTAKKEERERRGGEG